MSIYLICGVFYFSQWLCADFLISMKDRRNMKELGDLLVTSSLLLVIVCCHFPYSSDLNRQVADKWARTVCLFEFAANSSLVAAQPILKMQSPRGVAHGRAVSRL